MAEKCVWCADKEAKLKDVEIPWQKTTETVKLCGDHCEEQTRAFYKYAETHLVHFLVGLFGLPAIGLAVTLLMLKIDNGGVGMFIIFAGMGWVIIKYPFVTPQTIQLFGIKKSIRFVRIMGFLMILGGIACAAVMPFM